MAGCCWDGEGFYTFDYKRVARVPLHAVNIGDRIAQLILERISTPDVEEVASLPPSTGRGEAGFGSTGVHSRT